MRTASVGEEEGTHVECSADYPRIHTQTVDLGHRESLDCTQCLEDPVFAIYLVRNRRDDSPARLLPQYVARAVRVIDEIRRIALPISNLGRLDG